MITKPKVEIKGRIANVRIPESIMDEYTVKRICEEHDLLTSDYEHIHIRLFRNNREVMSIHSNPEYIKTIKF